MPENVMVVLFALSREARPFLRRFPRRRRLAGLPCRAWLCSPAGDRNVASPLLVLQTGINAVAMEKALTWLPQVPAPLFGSPRAILSAGFSGALQPDLNVGDLIYATEVSEDNGPCWPTTWPSDSWEMSRRRGRVLTVPFLVGDPEQKRLLGQRHDALAVDMESATVARLCQRHGIPFGCLRVISDDWNTPLSPQLVSLLAGGSVAPARLVAALLRQPKLIGELWHLGQYTRRAAENLSCELAQLLSGAAGY